MSRLKFNMCERHSHSLSHFIKHSFKVWFDPLPKDFFKVTTSDDPVIAKIGDRELKASEFEAYLKFKRIVVRTEEQVESTLDCL